MKPVGVRGRVFFAVPLLASCAGDAPAVTAGNWPEADALFHADPRWLGGDGAYTVDLGSDRTLWLFGDTFLAREPGGTRDDALFLRNSAALQTGRDPSSALMAFFWGADDSGDPRSLVEEDGPDWFWPGGGARIGSALLLFYGRIHAPDGDPSGWTMHDAKMPSSQGDVYPGNAVVLLNDYLYAYAEKSDVWHDVYLVRWPAIDAERGDLSLPQWWCDGSWSSSCAGGPSVVVPHAASELSVQPGGSLAAFVMVQTEGVGAATLALRTAPSLVGPWSEPQSFFRPPESRDGHTDVYAGKAHPGLLGADLVATYVAADLYYPRFVRVTYR
jgi:hypothetical protein